MRGFFNGLVLGIILGAAGLWFVQKRAAEHPEAQQRFEEAAAKARAAAGEAAENTSDAFKAKLDTLDLRPDEIKNELKGTGEIIRRRTRDIGETAVNTASDAAAVTEIKAKYAVDSTLSFWKISVECSHGHVTLLGTVSTPEDIGKAITLALETDGVRDVTSTLQIKPAS